MKGEIEEEEEVGDDGGGNSDGGGGSDGGDDGDVGGLDLGFKDVFCVSRLYHVGAVSVSCSRKRKGYSRMQGRGPSVS